MRKFLVWPDGHKKELTPLTYEEFNVLNLWSGSNDMAWKQWLYKNGYSEVDEFTVEALYEARFVLEPGDPSLLFNLGDDDEDWHDYSNNIYDPLVKETSIKRQSLHTSSEWDKVTDEISSDIGSITRGELSIEDYNKRYTKRFNQEDK